jgi:hypothetical protein
VHKTTLVIDDAKLERARELLGTEGIWETIDRALDEVIAMDIRRRFADRLRAMEGLDLDDSEVMDQAWR